MVGVASPRFIHFSFCVWGERMTSSQLSQFITQEFHNHVYTVKKPYLLEYQSKTRLLIPASDMSVYGARPGPRLTRQ